MKRIVFIALFLLFAAIHTAQAAKLGEPIEDIGTALDLPNKQFLQLAIEEKRIVAHFYDESEKIIESPADSIVFIIDQPGHKSDEFRTVLKPSDEDASLRSKRVLPPPYKFRARVIIRFTDKTTKTFPYADLKLDRNVE